MTKTKRHWVLFTVLLILYAVLLCLDLYLVEWYDDFYSAIQDRSKEKFSSELLTFVALTLAQALALGLIAFNSEVFEAELKKIFVTQWVASGTSNTLRFKQIKGDQKIIDDANLAAEKVAVILPALIFNSIKSLVFLVLLAQYPTTLFSEPTWPDWFENLGLSIFGIAYILVQILVIKRATAWVTKSENIKRSVEARTRYRLLSGDMVKKDDFVQVSRRYLRGIVKIRILVAKAHGVNVLSINSMSSLSFIIPFIAIFTSYSSGVITFGELMKISAIYAGFQGSALYVFNTYKEALIGVSALNRLNLVK